MMLYGVSYNRYSKRGLVLRGTCTSKNPHLQYSNEYRNMNMNRDIDGPLGPIMFVTYRGRHQSRKPISFSDEIGRAWGNFLCFFYVLWAAIPLGSLWRIAAWPLLWQCRDRPRGVAINIDVAASRWICVAFAGRTYCTYP